MLGLRAGQAAGHPLGALEQLERHQLEALLLKAADDLAHQATLDTCRAEK